jgi:hypothetical protein
MSPGEILSKNCRYARDLPSRRHHCTGCHCWCHAVRAPTNFRSIYEQAKAEKRSTGHVDRNPRERESIPMLRIVSAVLVAVALALAGPTVPASALSSAAPTARVAASPTTGRVAAKSYQPAHRGYIGACGLRPTCTIPEKWWLTVVMDRTSAVRTVRVTRAEYDAVPCGSHYNVITHKVIR